MLKDHCPNCDHRFGFWGAPFTLPPRGSSRRHPDYHCPACGSHLRRVDAPLEALAKWVGYLALLMASAGMLWHTLEVPVRPSREWLLALYAVAAVGILLNLVFSISRQHFVPDTSPREPHPLDVIDQD